MLRAGILTPLLIVPYRRTPESLEETLGQQSLEDSQNTIFS
jgi:hypothetical protein